MLCIMPTYNIHPLNILQLRTACSSCSVHELCLPAGLDQSGLEQLDRIVNRKRPLKRGEYLYLAGRTLQSLYALRTGIPALQHPFPRIMSREIPRDYGVMLLLGSMRAEERLAAFLLNLSQR